VWSGCLVSEVELARFGLCHHAVEIPAGVERKCSTGLAEAQARATIAVLDRLEELFADGERWIRRDFRDNAGGYCLVGGSRQIRMGAKRCDLARIYLSQAISRGIGTRVTLIDFNDGSHRKYADIRLVILLARKLAQEVAEGQV
jgi:hypothetical protein